MLSLKELCLNSVIKDFERFYFAFKESNDETLKINLIFLQRKYSFELASKLFKERKLEDKYLDFLLNEYLNELNGCWLKSSHVLTLSEELLRRLSNLSKIYFPVRCCDGDVKNIAKFCPKLTEIDLTRSRVTDNGIKYLCKDENGKFPCPGLKELLIEDSNITDEGVKHLLQNLPLLESIDYAYVPFVLYSLHKDYFPKHKKLHYYNLTSLDFSEVDEDLLYYNDILKICLALCPKLKSLERCSISNDQQLNLFGSLYLERLNLTFKKTDSKICLNNFLKNNGCNLTHLSVENCIVSISDLSVGCPKLNRLFMGDVTFTDNDDSEPVFPCLTKCIFFNNKDSSTDKGMRIILLFSPKLECIVFIDCALSPDIKTHLLKCCENHVVQKIIFMLTPVDVNFVRDIILSCPSLITLHMYRCLCYYRDLNKLVELSKTLPNKPHIEFNTFPFEVLYG